MALSRRQLLLGHAEPQPAAIRLPWSISEATFTNGCTRCGDCLPACPQGIVVKGAGGFPQLNFALGECTFCGACADTCTQPLFERQSAPWHYVARLNDACLTQQGIVCQNCKDACEPRAIRFRFGANGIAKPEINADDCTGCGACIAPCPSQAIALHTQSPIESCAS